MIPSLQALLIRRCVLVSDVPAYRKRISCAVLWQLQAGPNQLYSQKQLKVLPGSTRISKSFVRSF